MTDARITVRLQARARRDELIGIIRGERAREKLIQVHGLDQSALNDALTPR